jgi:hypothetical protein
MSIVDPTITEDAIAAMMGVGRGETIPLRYIPDPTRTEIRKVTKIVRETFGQFASGEDIGGYVADVIYIAKLRWMEL